MRAVPPPQPMSDLDLGADGPIAPIWRLVLRDAARYWEPRRLAYNIVLTFVALLWLLVTWPHFRPVLHNAHYLGSLLVLALIANACYSAAYVVEFAGQSWSRQETWHAVRRILWLTGTLLAIAAETYWIADEIYPFVE